MRVIQEPVGNAWNENRREHRHFIFVGMNSGPELLDGSDKLRGGFFGNKPYSVAAISPTVATSANNSEWEILRDAGKEGRSATPAVMQVQMRQQWNDFTPTA